MKKLKTVGVLLILAMPLTTGVSRAEDDQACADMVAAFEAQNAAFAAD